MSAAGTRSLGRASDGSGLRKRQPGFTQMSNATAQDTRLSGRARGVLVFLLSLPVDWKLRQPWLVAQFPEGRVAVMGAVRELRRRGHYRVERRRRLDGTFTTGVSISDECNPEWVAQHDAACRAQGTDKPKWDVTVRLLADGRVEDELASLPAAPPPVPEEEATSASDTEGDDAVTIDRKQETGHRKTGHRSTGHRRTGDRSTHHQYEEGDTDTQTDEREQVSSVGDARERGAPHQRSAVAQEAWERTRRQLATRQQKEPVSQRQPAPQEPTTDAASERTSEAAAEASVERAPAGAPQ